MVDNEGGTGAFNFYFTRRPRHRQPQLCSVTSARCQEWGRDLSSSTLGCVGRGLQQSLRNCPTQFMLSESISLSLHNFL